MRLTDLCKITLLKPIFLGALLMAAPMDSSKAQVGPNTNLDSTGMMLSDIAISVRDMERSLRFYEALGFEISGSRPIRAAVAKVLELKGPFKARMAFARRNGVVLELVEVSEPAVAKAPTNGIAESLGLGHIGIRVDNVDRVAKIIEANGGKTLPHTRLTGEGRDLLFCTDPDGTRIELIFVDPAYESQAQAPPRGVRQ